MAQVKASRVAAQDPLLRAAGAPDIVLTKHRAESHCAACHAKRHRASRIAALGARSSRCNRRPGLGCIPFVVRRFCKAQTSAMVTLVFIVRSQRTRRSLSHPNMRRLCARAASPISRSGRLRSAMGRVTGLVAARVRPRTTLRGPSAVRCGRCPIIGSYLAIGCDFGYVHRLRVEPRPRKLRTSGVLTAGASQNLCPACAPTAHSPRIIRPRVPRRVPDGASKPEAKASSTCMEGQNCVHCAGCDYLLVDEPLCGRGVGIVQGVR